MCNVYNGAQLNLTKNSSCALLGNIDRHHIAPIDDELGALIMYALRFPTKKKQTEAETKRKCNNLNSLLCLWTSGGVFNFMSKFSGRKFYHFPFKNTNYFHGYVRNIKDEIFLFGYI